MQIIFDTALPIFAVIFCGYGAGRLRLLSEASITGINAFVFFFALPTFLFNLMATSPMSEIVNGPFIAAYISAGLAVYAVAALLGQRAFGLRPGESAMQGAAAVVGNTIYMGLPMVIAVFGEEAAIPMALVLTLEVTLLIPLTMAIVQADRRLEGQRPELLRSVVGALIRNPLIIAIFGGVLISASGLHLPTPVANFTDLLGSAAAPSALFALGATLAASPISKCVG